MSPSRPRPPIDLSLGQITLGDAPVPLSGNAYGAPGGEIATRQAFARWLGVEVERLAVVAGASMGLTSALATLPRPGRVLCPRPFYPIFPRLAGLLGLELEYYDLSPETGWQLDFEAIGAAGDRGIAAVLVNWPGNPLGNLPTEATLSRLARFIQEQDAEVIADEAYADFVYEPSSPLELEDFLPIDRLVRIRSGSKLLRLPGERIGCVIAPTERLFRICHAHWTLALSPPAHAQREATHRLSLGIEAELQGICDDLGASRSAMHGVFSRSPLVEVDLPAGGIFLWVRLHPQLDLERVVSLCMEHGVVVSPGHVFGVDTPACLRLSFAVSRDDARAGAERVLHAVQQANEERPASIRTGTY